MYELLQKIKAGTCAPEDTCQNSQEDVSDDAKENEQHDQQIVNNVLDNLLFTMILSWVSLIHIAFSLKGAHRTTHIILFSLIIAMRVARTITNMFKVSTAKFILWVIGILCSFGTAINGVVASFRVPEHHSMHKATIIITVIVSLLM